MKISSKKIIKCISFFAILAILSISVIYCCHREQDHSWTVKESDFGYLIRTGSMFDLQEEWADKISFYDLDETVDKLVNDKISLARFGNGELDQILGRPEVFQRPSAKLSSRLKEVLASTDPRIGIGLPLNLFTKSKRIKSKYAKKNAGYWTEWGDKFREVIFSTAKRHTYFPAEITSREFQSEYFFTKIRTVWQDRDVHLIHGVGIFKRLEYDIFDNAKSVTHQLAPSRDAFEEYDFILEEALKTDKNKLVIIILGPTATVLAYDLAKQGYQALDLGHIAKNYDWYKRGIHDERAKGLGYFYGAD